MQVMGNTETHYLKQLMTGNNTEPVPLSFLICGISGGLRRFPICLIEKGVPLNGTSVLA
jgi:hypothetical protein